MSDDAGIAREDVDAYVRGVRFGSAVVGRAFRVERDYGRSELAAFLWHHIEAIRRHRRELMGGTDHE